MTERKFTPVNVETALSREWIAHDDECTQCGDRLRDSITFYAGDYGNYCSRRCAEHHIEFVESMTKEAR